MAPIGCAFLRSRICPVAVVVFAAIEWTPKFFASSLGVAEGPSSVTVGSTANVTVIDGDTIRSGSVTYRLGIDAPERGDRALCDRERELAEQASARLRSLITEGQAALDPTACACSPGTEGSRSCNFGRACAFLKVGGNNVGEILIREGLAQPFVCGRTRCPARRSWC